MQESESIPHSSALRNFISQSVPSTLTFLKSKNPDEDTTPSSSSSHTGLQFPELPAPRMLRYRPKLTSSSSFFNRLQRRHVQPLIVIDARSLVEIEHGTIASCILLPEPLRMKSNDKFQTIQDLLRLIQFTAHRDIFANRSSNDVVLYHSMTSKTSNEESWVLKIARLLHEENAVNSILILADSFRSFQRKYPMMTTQEYRYNRTKQLVYKDPGALTSDPPSAHIYPSVIEEGFLFVGTSQEAQNKSIVTIAGVTHIINCSSSAEEALFEQIGIKYHHMRIEIGEDMEFSSSIAFDKAYEFISNARENSEARVLVHSPSGGSRCCALAVFYLMKSRYMTLEKAYNYVLQHRPEMMPREALISILRRKEQELLGYSSIERCDVKALMHGQFLRKKERSMANRSKVPVAVSTCLDSSDSLILSNSRTARVVKVHKVESRWLFNRLQSGSGMILVDARSHDDFEDDTIRSAINVSPMENCQHMQQVDAEILPEQRHVFSRRRLTEVIVFAEDDTDPWVAALTQLLVTEARVACVKILVGGFHSFRYRYPFLTTGFDWVTPESQGMMRTRSGMHAVSFPNEILDGFLYLGNMWQASQEAVINNLNISHVVNASLDCANIFEEYGVEYLNVRLKDKEYSDISAFFESTYDFIDAACQTPGSRVLVHCTQGISRSATLVIYYLMRKKRWSMVTAMNYLLDCRGIAYPNFGFLKQLVSAERMLYNANSICEEELDSLLQGAIPDRPVPKSNLSGFHKEKCDVCFSPFPIFSRRHSCHTCKRTVCSKCACIRLIDSDREKLGQKLKLKGNRVCNGCIRSLRKIELGFPNNCLRRRCPRHVECYVSSTIFKSPVTLCFYEGTDKKAILDVIRARFSLGECDILDLLLENGETLDFHQPIPDHASIFVSVGALGAIRECNGSSEHHKSSASCALS